MTPHWQHRNFFHIDMNHSAQEGPAQFSTLVNWPHINKFWAMHVNIYFKPISKFYKSATYSKCVSALWFSPLCTQVWVSTEFVHDPYKYMYTLFGSRWVTSNKFANTQGVHGGRKTHYNDIIMSAMASQIASLTIVYFTVYSGTDERKHQSSASLAFVRGIHRWPVNSPHEGPVTRKMFPFDDVIMINRFHGSHCAMRMESVPKRSCPDT